VHKGIKRREKTVELKKYQKQVIDDLEDFLEYVQEYDYVDTAFNEYWADKVGAYNPLEGKGMQPYKNTIPNAAHVCIKVPTAGGKTFIAVNALHSIFSAIANGKPKAVVWLVPWSNLLQQTVGNLSNPDHPYRQKLNALFNHRVEVYEKQGLLQGSNFNPTVVQEQLSIFVMNFASLRARKKEDRKVNEENGQLEAFVAQYPNKDHLLEGVDETALINVIRSLNPVLVVDESHNAESDLSVDMLKNLNPSFILDLSATPKNNSNIVSLVPAIELKKEHMVKLPVIIHNAHDKSEVVDNALHLRKRLEALAIEEQKQGGPYIRPIVLFQAQPKTAKDNTTFEKLKKQLLELGIPENQIKIKTANIDELKGIDLMSKDCEVRYIITINALKEGWDCPFAYVLASLANKSSAVDVEQILGRVLRQPYVFKHQTYQLNLSYVLTASAKFSETLDSIVKGLQASGFSSKDHRKIDSMSEEEKTQVENQSVEQLLFPEQQEQKNTDENEASFDISRVSFTPNEPEPKELLAEPQDNSILNQIETLAQVQNQELEQQIQQQDDQSPQEAMLSDMDTKVNNFKVKEVNEKYVEGKDKSLSFPQFFLKVENSLFSANEYLLLNRGSLLGGFNLAVEDIKINFEKRMSEIYKADMEMTTQGDARASVFKIEESSLLTQLGKDIFSMSQDGQVREVAHQITNILGSINPIAEQDIKSYVQRIIASMTEEQRSDVIHYPQKYKKAIKEKIRLLSDKYAEDVFNDYITTGKVITQASWYLPSQIIVKKCSKPIGKSLYEVEDSMNTLEEKAIMELSALDSVDFWHRNQEKGKGFKINGFMSNHYPDFIVKTDKGNTIIIETKGDHLDNSDSMAKARLGKRWAELAGKNFHYFMVFETKDVPYAITLTKAKELIRQM